MDPQLLSELTKVVEGDVSSDQTTLNEYSHDASLFEVIPQAVVFPKNQKDVENLVTFVAKNKKKYPKLSLTGRSAGTDMGGGSINDSIIVAFSKYFNATPTIKERIATTQPGVFYRDFEKETLKEGLLFPSYPASRGLCAMGGIVNNNCSITSEKIILQGSVTNLGSGSLMNCVKLNLNNNTINFSGGSMLIFTDITDIYAFKALSDASEYSVMKCLGTMPDFRYTSSQFKGKIELVHINLVSGDGVNGRVRYEGLFNNNGSILSKEQTKNIVGTTCNGGEGEIVPPAPPVIDNDGDGVAVENDYDDSDANVAFASYFPTENTRGTYAFEDLWPWKGDYDMNDLVMTFRIKYLSNASNKVTSIIFDYNVIAAGSMQDLSAAFQLDKVNASDVKSVTGQTLGSTIPFDINSNGTEKGATTAIIPLFNKVSDLVTYTSFLNTVNGQFEQTPNKTLVIKFNTGIDQSNLTIANFNMFIVANTKGSTSRGKEIHLPTYKATSKADPSFATGKQLSANDKYKFEDGMMWGLMFPSVFQYPQESKALFDAYLHFKAWAFSGGNEYKDWYTDKSGYINQSLIYEK